jgi:hypothetical protein
VRWVRSGSLRHAGAASGTVPCSFGQMSPSGAQLGQWQGQGFWQWAGEAGKLGAGQGQLGSWVAERLDGCVSYVGTDLGWGVCGGWVGQAEDVLTERAICAALCMVCLCASVCVLCLRER